MSRYVRALGAFTFNDYSRADGDQTCVTERGTLLPAEHWAVRAAPDKFEHVDLPEDVGETVDALARTEHELAGMVGRLGGDRQAWPTGHRQRADNLERRVAKLAGDLNQWESRERRRDELRARWQSGDLVSEGGAVGMHSVTEAGYDAGPGGRGPGTGHHGGSSRRDPARRALDSLGSVPDDGRERLTRAFERAEADTDGGHELDLLSRWLLATSTPAYSRAVGKLFRDPENGHREFEADELAAYRQAKTVQRAMSIGTDSAGGFLLPTHLDPAIMLSNAGAVDPIRRIARVETIVTDTWNGISSAGVTASWDGEAAEVSDDSPTLAQPAVPTHKAQACVAASIEAAMDTTIGEQVARLFIDAKERLEATAFIDGTGTDQPTGIVTALPAGSKVAAATADTIVADDVTGLQNDLSPRWQPRAQWCANLTTANEIAAFETTNGALRFPEMAGDPPRLLRKPFNECSNLDAAGDTASADNDNVVLYGDYMQYLVVDRVGATVEFIPHLFGANRRPTGQRGWYMYWRTGGDVLIDDAFRLLTA